MYMYMFAMSRSSPAYMQPNQVNDDTCKTVKSTDLDLQNHPQKCNKETKSLQPSLPGKNACSKFYVKAYPAEKCQYEKDNPKQ